MLRCFGVALHETFHAKHTKRWAVEHDLALADSSDPAERQLAVDRRLLEEPRMEAHGVREFAAESVRGRFVRRALEAAVVDVILPRFAEQLADAALAGQPLTRDMAGRASVYLQARTHYGIVDPGVLAALAAVWRQVLGDADLRALDDLYARLVWIADGELDALDDAARAYREIIGAPDPPQSGEGEGSGAPGAGGQSAGSGDTPARRRRRRAAAGRHRIAGRRARARARTGARRPARAAQRGPRPRPAARRRRATRASRSRAAADQGPACRAGGCPTAASTARRSRTRSSRRAATPPACARRSPRARARSTSAPPAGASTDAPTRAARPNAPTGRPVSAHPWQITRQVRAPIEAPHVGLVIDTSGSMGAYEYALGPIAWILTDGLRQIGGRCASALFGNGAELLADGAAPLPLVPGIATGGGTAFAGDAIELVCEQLEMTNPRRPRFLYVLSDGGWADTQAGVQKIRWLAEHAVPTIHLSIGIAPLSVECDRITVITDPADALDHVAADTVAALRAARAPRRPR